MVLKDEKITKAIVERYTQKFIENLNQDVIIAGAEDCRGGSAAVQP